MKNKRPAAFLLMSLNGMVVIFFLVSCGLFFYEDTSTSTVYSQPGETADYPENLYYVDQVVDGDTFSINTGHTIRMLGINTPEIDRYFYDEAREILDIMIGSKPVMLEKDITEKDSYGRLLRYVFAGDLFVNLEMVLRGYANVYTLPPDVRYMEDLLEAERYARENELGLWAIAMHEYNIRLVLNHDAEGDDRKNLNGEYLTLRNESRSDYNIKGWTIKDSGTGIYEFRSFLFLKGTEITLFTGSGQDMDGNFYWNSKIPVWNNDHDSVYLRDREGLLVGFIRY